MTNDSTLNERPSQSPSNSSLSANDQTNQQFNVANKSSVHSISSTPSNTRKISTLLSTTSPIASPKLLSNFKSHREESKA